MRYSTLFKAQCSSLPWICSQDEVSVASSFVFGWHASVINGQLVQVEVPNRKELQHTNKSGGVFGTCSSTSQLSNGIKFACCCYS